MMARLARRSQGEEGFALIVVLASMTIVTLFLLTSLAYVLNDMKPSRGDQDAKAALAAAQAGIDEYLARLNANDTYWSTTDCNNIALVPSPPATCPAGRPAQGVAVPGTAGAATYRYRVLTTNADTTRNGVVQLAVTGFSRDRSRELLAELSPAGFLRYIYFTDKEVTDPAVDADNPAATRNGQTNLRTDDPATSTTTYTYWYADTAVADTLCNAHWYAGRSAPSYTSGPYLERVLKVTSGAVTSDVRTVQSASPTNRIAFSCEEIKFTDGDRVAGKLKTNDAMLLEGAPLFTDRVTETGWATAPDRSRPWRGTGEPSAGTSAEPGYRPVYAAPLQMPDSNAALRTAATTTGVGCLYSGVTRLTFQSDGQLQVLSPGTPATSGCGGGSTAKIVPLPSVVYVQDLPAAQSCTDQLNFPAAGEVVTRTSPDYSCRKGNAYVSGVVRGRTTVGAANDVVVVGDTTYAGGMDGTDALGLIPQNFAWIYHPLKADGTEVLITPVRKLDAAVLSVNHSFLVQNHNRGTALSTTAQDTKLRVRGSIAQRFRGPVGAGTGPTLTGYLKDYQYDTRLDYAPPPYFLKPVSSPYLVAKVTD